MKKRLPQGKIANASWLFSAMAFAFTSACYGVPWRLAYTLSSALSALGFFAMAAHAFMRWVQAPARSASQPRDRSATSYDTVFLGLFGALLVLIGAWLQLRGSLS
jgi:uncharacterized membrane protein